MRKDWYSAISRGSAPFQRNIVISTDFLCWNEWQIIPEFPQFGQFWLLVEEATTLVVCGSSEKGASNSVVKLKEQSTAISKLWKTYTQGDSNHRQINKVIYANMALHSTVFRCSAVRRVGFETMLHHSTLLVPIADILRHGATDARFKKLFTVDFIDLKITDQKGLASYILSAADVKEMEKQHTSKTMKSINPVAEYFARKHCTYLADSRLAVLSKGKVLGRIGPRPAVRDFVEHLINRYLTLITSC